MGLRRKGAAFLLAVTVAVLAAVLPVGAEERAGEAVLSLTLQDCYDRALAHTHKLVELDKQFDTLWEQHNDQVEFSRTIQDQMDLLERYRQLYEKIEVGGYTLTVEDQYNLIMYKAMFGERPPEYTPEEMFNKYIKLRDFPHYSLWSAAQNVKTAKEFTAASIKAGVKGLFDSIIDLEETLTLQNGLLVSLMEQNKQISAKFKLGIASELDKYVSDVGIEQQRLTVASLQRSISSLKISLNSQMGLSLNREISLNTNRFGSLPQMKWTLDQHMEKALTNRYEILTSKLDLQVKQREYDILKQYIPYDFHPDHMEAKQALDEKRIAYDEAVETVTQDITQGYKDVLKKRKAVDTAEKKRVNARKNFAAILKQYEKGLMDYAALMNMEVSVTRAEIECKKAARDYNHAFLKLDTACGIGPGYMNSVTNQGGK